MAMRISLFMLLYVMTAAAGCMFLWQFVDGSILSGIVIGCALVWLVGAGTLLAIYRNPDRPSRRAFEAVVHLMLAATLLMMLTLGCNWIPLVGD